MAGDGQVTQIVILWVHKDLIDWWWWIRGWKQFSFFRIGG